MASIIFTTDQSGANQNICSTAVASTVTFNFSLSSNYDAYSANITMKKASGTTAPVVVTIYNQPNGGGSSVGSSTVLAANITQSFAPIEFLFSSLSLTAGTSYSLVLSSTTSCSGSNPYSFKSGNFQVTDKVTGAVINTGYGIASAMTSVATLTSSPKTGRAATKALSSVSTLSATATKSKALNASLSASASLTAGATRSRTLSASLSSTSTLSSSAKNSRSAASNLTSSATLSATAAKSKTLSASAYVVSALTGLARVVRNAVATLQSRSVSSATVAATRNSSCEIKSQATLSSAGSVERNLAAEINSSSTLESNAEITRGINSAHEMNCSLSASSSLSRGVAAGLTSSVSLQAEMSGAKSLFSVFAPVQASSKVTADPNVQRPVDAEGDGSVSLSASAMLVANAILNMVSISLLEADASITGEVNKKKREGSGHYVLNSGAFTLRQWKRFIKASDNHIPNRREPESKRIDLRAPGLLRRLK